MTEQDFELKARIREVLWKQGFSTRVDVLLAYDINPSGTNRSGKAGITDVDVLGIRLLPGFRTYAAIADCRTSRGKVPERLFWLAGLAQFFDSQQTFLVRGQTPPAHATPLARSLGLTLVGPDDLEVMDNILSHPMEPSEKGIWDQFFSAEILGNTLHQLGQVPGSLRNMSFYRETRYWMESPNTRLFRVVAALSELTKDGFHGRIAEMVFADFVWLYTIAVWKACEAITRDGITNAERGLELFLHGGEAAVRQIKQARIEFETLARIAKVDATLPVNPPYFSDLLELVVRCIRRPEATSRLARRAEWLLIGQLVGHLGGPLWAYTDEDRLADKLLGDIAHFLARSSRLESSILNRYLDALVEPSQSLTTDASTVVSPQNLES